jgi:hypothetical protein
MYFAMFISFTRSEKCNFSSVPSNPQNFVTSRLFKGEELLTPHPTPKLKGPLLSAVRYCLFNIYAATLQIWRPSLPSATRGCSMPTRYLLIKKKNSQIVMKCEGSLPLSQLPPLELILDQMNTVYTLTSYFNFHFNIILPSTSRFPKPPLRFGFSD